MNDVAGVAVMFVGTFLGMFFVLYTGQSTSKRTGLTMKQTIDGWRIETQIVFWSGILWSIVFVGALYVLS